MIVKPARRGHGADTRDMVASANPGQPFGRFGLMFADAPICPKMPDGTGGLELAGYLGGDIARMTVGGELNKQAANVAMGRSIGGVHWRSDNTRSLRLGEQISAFILAKVTVELKERPLSFSFTSFNGKPTRIEGGSVLQGGATIDPRVTML